MAAERCVGRRASLGLGEATYTTSHPAMSPEPSKHQCLLTASLYKLLNPLGTSFQLSPFETSIANLLPYCRQILDLFHSVCSSGGFHVLLLCFD